ncbi:MAG TPA: FMN-binding glutamate synthase family protein [Gammaproteobacteria bacterium]|nr:FMN-binding glutamate synthase family protein [Gammaproteobacteria bacterium]
MMRAVYYGVSALVLAVIGAVYVFWHPIAWLLVLAVPYILIGLYDINSPHNVLRNYPVIGHLRYMMEFISPEIRQYFVETNQSGRPFNREMRTLIYRRSKGNGDTLPFGTQQDITVQGYDFAYHSLAPRVPPAETARIAVGGPQCSHPYDASRLNISGMSFGALSGNAILALNRGALLGGFAHNTGEGGLSRYHLRHGGDIVWQIGTGYFGCRTPDGGFDPEQFREKARLDAVKMIEIKLSQGAKPSHGGVLPGVKVNGEIAAARGVALGEDCISPPAHSEFGSPEGLLEFVARLREMSGGKPVGFKLCLGIRSEFLAICKAMRSTGILPDFITVDGAEGGTGAAPVEFTDNLGTPINEGLAYVHSALTGAGLRENIRLIASGKVATGFDMVIKHALGAELCNVARPMMFSLGCIQALRCNTNTCPTGVTTQDPRRSRALDVETKHVRVRNLHGATLKSFLDLTGALGHDDPDRLTPDLIWHRRTDGPAVTYADIYSFLRPNQLLEGVSLPADWEGAWHRADARSFRPAA